MADSHVEGSLANRLRKKRFAFFLKLADALKPPYRILDVGGTQIYWEQMGFADREGVTIDLLNLEDSHIRASLQRPTAVTFNHIIGDATHMPQFGDGSYEIVFSNSVIEHLPSREMQLKMADEIRRIGQRYFVQTPNFWFPIEPHFFLPGFHYLPLEWRVRLIMETDIFWYPRIPEREKAEAFMRAFRLLTRDEFQSLFPDGRLYAERFMGLVKSYSAYGGWDAAEPDSGILLPLNQRRPLSRNYKSQQQ